MHDEVSVKEGVGTIMGGKILEYEAKTIKREGIEQGIERGIEQGIKQGIEQGIEKGIEQGIRGTVSILKNMGVPAQTIQIKIQEQYHLSQEASKKYL